MFQKLNLETNLNIIVDRTQSTTRTVALLEVSKKFYLSGWGFKMGEANKNVFEELDFADKSFSSASYSYYPGKLEVDLAVDRKIVPKTNYH